jgi:acyl carrier protein
MADPDDQADAGHIERACRGAVFERVCDIVREHCPVDPGALAASTHLTSDLGYDSMGIADLLMALQIEFRLEPPGDYTQVYAIATVGDLAAAVESARGSAA